MMKLALMFLAIGLIAGLLGFTGIASVSVGFAKILFTLGLVGFIIFAVAAYTMGKKVLK